MRLQNKKAVVTGANRSIGRGIAERFAKEGADVVISYRSDEEGAKEVVSVIESCGRMGKAVWADFSSRKGVEHFFGSVLKSLDQIDILVNCAAGYDTSSFLDLEVEVFEHVLQVGVATAMLLSQLVARHMIERKVNGSIINISSISGLRPFPNRTAHSCAKAALNMLTQSSALELAKHEIRVNALAPGATPYEPDQLDGFECDAIPLKRSGTPEDQAGMAVYLASDESSWMTG